MTHIVADRFVARGAAWLDLATGASARLLVAAVEGRAAQLAWSARCAAQANLRHPAINALVDFGPLDRDRAFEAYEARPPLHAAGAAGIALLEHAVRFLEAHGVLLERPLADFALRPIVAGPALRRSPIGIVLQPRPAFDAVAAALDAMEPAGPCQVDIVGGAHSGLRTLRVMVARAARLRGFVALDAGLVRRAPSLAGRFRDRHICVLGELDAFRGGEADIATFLARVGVRGGRRHVLVRFAREGARERGAPAIHVSPMGASAMAAMVFTHGGGGPAAEELFEAARGADGLPGLFLARLGGGGFGAMPRGHERARETAPAYVPAGDPPSPSQRGANRRLAGVLLRAVPRAEALATRGRHGEAARILTRAVRVLTARGEGGQAARCALALGRLLHDRGRIDAAAGAFETARELEPDSRLSVEATLALGLAWLDDGRFVDAEAALRTAHVGARGLNDPALDDEIAASLAECLRLQGRTDEAVALPAIKRLHGEGDAPVSLRAAAARVWLAAGQWPGAMRAARQAVDAAIAHGDPRSLAIAHHAMAAVLAAAGDRDAARRHAADGLSAARAAHLPVQAMRLRVMRARLADSSRRSRGRQLPGGAARALPGLLRREIESAREGPAASGPAITSGPVADLEALIEVAHAAADDETAIGRIAAALGMRLRSASVMVLGSCADMRVLALHGRTWGDECRVGERAMASGLGAAGEPGHEPFEAAEPLRYGGEVIGAVAARWLPGSTLDHDRASALLRVGALALAGSVRAVLDRRVALPSAEAAGDLVGDSEAARALREAIVRAARAPFPVLVEGESGSGKELVARAIHRLSTRSARRFCPVNCAAIADDLLEAELFGHVRGAFTGAVGERAGLFEEADGGTLFLDEIGELSARAQAKLLRVLQDGEVRRIGENMPRRVDARIVAATNRRLAQEAASGRFRADLRFRLDVVRIDVPPLRERPGDVPLLATHFWNDASARVGSRATLSPDALAALSRYDWPGNVRELQNVIAWMAVQSARRGRIGIGGLPAHIAQSAAPMRTTFEAARAEFERRFVRAALATANGQRASAAAALGVSRQGLAKMMRRLGLDTETRA